MSFTISAYLLEPPRVGQSNSPYTQTPDNYISNQTTFDTAYPSDESAPRTDYLVFVWDEGTSQLAPLPSTAGLLANAKFSYSKNEVINRFAYSSRDGRFKLLPGNAIIVVGVLGPDSNTTRLKVLPPAQVDPWADAPYRLSVGTTGSGQVIIISLVGTDGGFGTPAPGTVQLSMTTGNLNWNTTDLTTYAGQTVRFQQQQFYDYTKSTGRIGYAPVSLSDALVFLNPKPGTGQYPLLRFGYGFYFQTTEVADDTGLAPAPASGYVKWSLTTGRLAFNATDAANNVGVPVYYDGVVFARDLMLPRQVLGDISAPASISSLPPEGVDLIFSLPNVIPYYQFPQFTYVDSFDSGEVGVVQVNPDTGDVQFSDADQATFDHESVTLIKGDLTIERGIKIRFLRTPVNLDGRQGTKDVTAIYSVSGATWANPIIESPQVSLPSIPINTTEYPLTVKILQGEGFYTSNNFPRLDVSSPPTSFGYYIDFDSGTFYFAQRKSNVTVPIVQKSNAVLLSDPLVQSISDPLKLDGNDQFIGTDVLVEQMSGMVSFITVFGEVLIEGTNTTFVGTTFMDANSDFVVAGVLPGYLLEINAKIYTVSSVTSAHILETDVAPSAPVNGTSYRIRDGREVLADRYFEEVSLIDPSTKVERIRFLGITSNTPRLNIPVTYVSRSRFRFGPAANNQFATVVLVPTDGDFTIPTENVVEISEATGHLNFATENIGQGAYWVKELKPKVDFTLSAGLGLIQFTERMMQLEEVLVTYTTAPPSTDPPTLPGPPIQEYASFLIRKEVTEDHPSPTTTLKFNTVGLYVPSVSLPVVSTPSPAVFRGGRPQQLEVQCVVDITNSTITFLADNQITDALPHGATVNPNERVYIDYYVAQAVGGEKTTSVLYPPLLTAVVNITDGANNFEIYGGDYTASFPVNYLFRIEKEQIYLIANSTYDAGNNKTTVTLYGNQQFQDSFNDPKVYVSSGATPIVSAPLIPSYFTIEIGVYETIARGSNQFYIAGDHINSYRVGTVLMFTNGGATFTDLYQVAGVSYDANTGRTVVSLTANTLRQYQNGVQFLYHSVRPVFEPPTKELTTSCVPVLTQPYTVYRRTTGSSGAIITSPTDYTIDESGRIVFASALAYGEEFCIFYTGYRVIEAGSQLEASYTCQITPNDTNGLVGQVLSADYYIWAPDSFYYRVETMTNFRGEYATEIALSASSGSSGPQTSNVSQPNLYSQGRPSLYFDEKHLANQDIIARSTLLFYNDAINYLEAYLKALDGRVVGNNDGPFLFDGTTGITNPEGSATFPNATTLEDTDTAFTSIFIGRYVKILSGDNRSLKRKITGVPTIHRLTLDPALPTTDSGRYRILPLNQIDDTIRISPAPYSVTFAGGHFVVTSIGTYAKNYLPGTLSRFYPTTKNFYGVSAVTDESVTGDEVLDTKSTQVTLVSELRSRLAWALVTESTAFSGPTTLKVDDANGSGTRARPPFKAGMKAVVQRRDGTFINDVDDPITITHVSATTLTISGLNATAAVGTTVYRSPADDSAQTGSDVLAYYALGRDYSFNGENGQVIYIEKIDIAAFENYPIIELQAISGKVNLINTLTEPLKFSGLYGGTLDDDGDVSFPIQTPDPECESRGYLRTEYSIIESPDGIIRDLTTAPFVSTGTLSGSTITNVGGAFPAPEPQICDLVRILTGTNYNSDFVRIVAVNLGAHTITVDGGFVPDPGIFTYEVSVSPDIAHGAATFPDTTHLDAVGAHFLTTAKVGYTVVLGNTGVLPPSPPPSNNAQRRQITAIDSDTRLTLSPALPTIIGCDYRISNSLATYGGASTDYLHALVDALTGEIAVYAEEKQYLLDFLDQVFTDISTSTTGHTHATTVVLDDVNGSFLTDDVTSNDYVYIVSGSNAGIYQVVSVPLETQLTVDVPFPATLSGIHYRVVSLFGILKESAKAIFDLYQSIDALAAAAAIFKALMTTRVPVMASSGMEGDSFTRATLETDLDDREALVVDRLNIGIPDDIDLINTLLESTDVLYDKRYVWISTRIALTNGLIVQQATAVTNRIKAQQDIYNQLTKLLAVEL